MIAAKTELEPMRGRSSILRPVGVLVVSSAALVLLIAITGDLRRRGNAMERARGYAAELALRAGRSSQLPLNLSSGTVESDGVDAVGMEWLSSADAYLLRSWGGPVLAAWSLPVVRAAGADGRAVILFENGSFSVRWVTLRGFARLQSAQASRVEGLRRNATAQAP